MVLYVVPKYAALLGFMYVILSLRVIRHRRLHRISLGHAGDEALERLIRAHGNFAEFAPFALLLLSLLEMQDWPALLIHLLCLTLVAGRALHAQALPLKSGRLRVAGMALTFVCMLTSSALLGLG